MKKKFVVLGLAALTALTGCSAKDSKEPVQEELAIEDNWLSNLDSIDLNGDKIDSTIFEDKDLTLVNVWATWCPPCIAEIPALAKLDKDYENVGVRGLIIEHDKNSKNMEILPALSIEEKVLAEDILEKSGAEYGQILVSEALLETDLARVVQIPTSYFVDSKGRFVGQPIMGAKSYDQWKFLIEERLEMLQNE